MKTNRFVFRQMLDAKRVIIAGGLYLLLLSLFYTFHQESGYFDHLAGYAFAGQENGYILPGMLPFCIMAYLTPCYVLGVFIENYVKEAQSYYITRQRGWRGYLITLLVPVFAMVFLLACVYGVLAFGVLAIKGEVGDAPLIFVLYGGLWLLESLFSTLFFLVVAIFTGSTVFSMMVSIAAYILSTAIPQLVYSPFGLSGALRLRQVALSTGEVAVYYGVVISVMVSALLWSGRHLLRRYYQ